MRSTLVACVCAAVVLLWIAPNERVLAQQVDPATRPRLDPEVEAIITGWRANRARFSWAHATMTKTAAYARSKDNALAGQYLPEPQPVRSERLWVTDGNTSRFEVTFPPELADQPRSQHVNMIEVRSPSTEALKKQACG